MPEEFDIEAVLSYTVASSDQFAWSPVPVDRWGLRLCLPPEFYCLHSHDSTLPSPAVQQVPGWFPLCHRQEGNLHSENRWETPYCVVPPLFLTTYLSKCSWWITAVNCLVFALRRKHRQLLKIISSRSVNVMLHKVVCNIFNFTPSDVRNWFILTTSKVIFGRPPTSKWKVQLLIHSHVREVVYRLLHASLTGSQSEKVQEISQELGCSSGKTRAFSDSVNYLVNLVGIKCCLGIDLLAKIQWLNNQKS